MSWRAGRDQRADNSGARARVQVGQAGADQRDRRRVGRQRNTRRQPARIDGIELAATCEKFCPPFPFWKGGIGPHNTTIFLLALFPLSTLERGQADRTASTPRRFCSAVPPFHLERGRGG